MSITELTGLGIEDDRLTPNLLAERAAAIVAELLPLRDAATDKRVRKDYSRRIKTARIMLKWAKSRAGYVPLSKGA